MLKGEKLRLYLTGASYNNAVQPDSHASLGGYKSAVVCDGLGYYRTNAINGLSIRHIHTSNGLGTGKIEIIDGIYAKWTDPSGESGELTELPYKTIVSIPSLDDSKFIQVERMIDDNLQGIETVKCVEQYNNIFGQKDVSEQRATDYITYRGIMMKWEHTGVRPDMVYFSINNPLINYNEYGKWSSTAQYKMILNAPDSNGRLWTINDEENEGYTLEPSETRYGQILHNLSTHHVNGTMGIWFERIPDYGQLLGPSIPIMIQYGWLISSTNESYMHYLYGRFRASDDNQIGYGLWLGKNTKPDYNGEPEIIWSPE